MILESAMALGLFFLNIALTIQGLLWLHTNFSIVSSISVKTAAVSFMVIALHMQIALGSVDILTVLLVYEHRVFFHLFVFCSISFISVL